MEDLVELGGFDRTVPTLILTECVLVYMTNIDSTYLVRSLASFLTPMDPDNINSTESSSSNTTHSMDTIVQGKNPFFCWASYDMVNPADPFGQTMLRNIQKRGFQLPGFLDYPTLSHHEDRFLRCASSLAQNDSSNPPSLNSLPVDVAEISESTIFKVTGRSKDLTDTTARDDYQWRFKSRTMLELYNFRNGVIDDTERKRIEKLELFDEVEEWNLIMSHYCMTICTVAADTQVDLLAEEFINTILP